LRQISVDPSMPALFAYLLAVSIVLGGGYAGLRWLSAPPHPSFSQRPSASEKLAGRKDAAEVSGAARANPAEKGPNDQSEKDITASLPIPESSNKASTELPSSQTAAGGTKEADNVPPGGCMPIGLTARGELVFAMQCKELLERHRGPVAVPTNSIQSAPAPKERQAAAPARSADAEEQSPSNKTHAKVEDVSPSGEATPVNKNSEPEAIKGQNVGRRNIEFSPSRNEEQWFNPLRFR
jgi:hypothetical protein